MPLSRRELGSRITQCGLGQLRSTSVPSGVFSSSIQPFGHNRHRPKIGWGSALFLGGSWVPSNTVLSGARLNSIPSGILVHPAVWPQQTWAKNWGLCPFSGGKLGPHLIQCRHRPTSVPSGILMHRAVWPQQTWAKNGGLCTVGGELGHHLTQCRLYRGLPPYQVTSSSKRFTLCYRTVVCPVLSVLSATLVHCGQTVG